MTRCGTAPYGRTDDETRRLALDAETTTEAWVWMDRAGRTGNAWEVDYTMVRTLIDARLAGEVYAEHADDLGTDDEIAALSEATLVAQAARDASFDAAGDLRSAEERYQSMAGASQELTAALATGTSSSTQLWTAFYEDLDLDAAQAGLTIADRADAASAASLAFRSALQVRSDVRPTFVADADRSGSMWEAWNASHALQTVDASADVDAMAAAFWDDAVAADTDAELLEAWDILAADLVLQLTPGGPLPVVPDYAEAVFDGEIDDVLGTDLDAAVDTLIGSFEGDNSAAVDGGIAARFWTDVRLAVETVVNEESVVLDEAVTTELLVHASAAHRIVY